MRATPGAPLDTVKGAGTRALFVALVIAGFLGWLHALGVGLPLLLGLALVFCIVALIAPRLGVRWIDDLILALRGLYWRREQGRFHTFGGVPLDIEDDGRQVWVAGEGLQRVLGTEDTEATLAARHAGSWRRNADDVLQLRVDAVVQHLNTMPGRHDPRVQRLRRYLEREVLFPAKQRRERAPGRP
jgi:hypothetical protein